MAELPEGTTVDVVQPSWIKEQMVLIGPEGPAGQDGDVPPTRQVIAGNMLNGGGTLAADRTFDVDEDELLAWLIARLVEGDNVVIDTTADPGNIIISSEAAGGGGGGLIGFKSHNTENYNPATPSSLTDIDATDLAVSFVVGASGSVLFNITGSFAQTGTATPTWLGLRESTTTVIERQIAGGNFSQYDTWKLVVTGLTPGSSHTYKLAWRGTAASGFLALNANGGGGGFNNPPAVIEAVDIPA